MLTLLKAAPLHLRLFGAIALVLAASASQSVFTYWTTIDNLAATESVQQAEAILALAGQARTGLLEMETSYHGFLLTGDQASLTSYAAAAQSYTTDLATLERLTADSPPQVARWQELEQQRAAWQRDVIEPGIGLRRTIVADAPSGQDARVLTTSDLGKQDINNSEHLIDDAMAAEQLLLKERHERTVTTNDRLVAELGLGTLAVLGVGLGIAVLFARNLAQAISQARAGERRYRQMFANNPAIKLLIDPTSGAIIEANQAACDFYGYPEEQLLCRHMSEISTHPSDVLLAKLARVAASERTSAVAQHRLASGQIRDVDIQASPVDDDLRGHALLYLIVQDVTDRKQAEAALSTSEERSRLALQASRVGTWDVDLVHNVHTWSVETEALFGLAPGAFGGTFASFLRLVHPDDRPTLEIEAEAAKAERRDSLTTYRTIWPDDSVHWVEEKGRPLYAADGTLVRMIGTSMDITDRKRAEEALRHQALHDALTDLPNRTLLQDRLSQAILAGTREDTPVALLLIDLDRFKEVNDTFGHHHGDLLLQQVGPRLASVLRASDTIARLGGDEFGVLLPGTSADSAVSVAEMLLGVLAAPFVLEGQAVQIGGSIGVAGYPVHGNDAPTLLRQADVAMYVAKRAQTGIVVYAAEQDHHSAERLALGGELRLAIENNELVLQYQPKVDLTGRLAGVEALVRWRHPQRGMIAPDEFIGLAEHIGLIKPLTRWVLDAALRQCRVWLNAGLAIQVAVNVSMHDLHDDTLPDTVARLLMACGVPAEYLRIEITEGAIMSDAGRALAVLTRLRALGVSISVDDFGTGYSSLAYLKRLPVDELKIDRSFICDIATDEEDAAIVRSTIGLGHELGLTVVAEGVEDQASWEQLRQFGCDLAQGFFMGRPLSASDLDRWITDSGQFPAERRNAA
jgi:diguanylate cyclase (GGDEF)-like protein/PAS domain S-box-containing protein